MTFHAHSRHVNTYHQNNSLLFQFILVEFVDAYEELLRLSALCQRKNAPISPEGQSAFFNQTQTLQIESLLAKLVGPRGLMRLFLWNCSEGILAKLRTYCALFLRNADSHEKDIALQHYADKIWQAGLNAMEILCEEPYSRPAFIAAISKAETAIQRLGKQIARVILHFGDDENVMFCLLKMKDRFDKLYGPRFVAKTLCKIFPKGLRNAQQIITKKYADRGFEHISPIIGQKINELEMNSL